MKFFVAENSVSPIPTVCGCCCLLHDFLVNPDSVYILCHVYLSESLMHWAKALFKTAKELCVLKAYPWNCHFKTVFTFCLYKASRSIRDEKLRLPEFLFGQAHSLAHGCSLMDFQKYGRDFQISVKFLILQNVLIWGQLVVWLKEFHRFRQLQC